MDPIWKVFCLSVQESGAVSKAHIKQDEDPLSGRNIIKNIQEYGCYFWDSKAMNSNLIFFQERR